MNQKLVFGCVGSAAHFLPSLAPCACTMVARSRQKICATALPNSQLLIHFRYNLVAVLINNYLLKIKNSGFSNSPEYVSASTFGFMSCVFFFSFTCATRSICIHIVIRKLRIYQGDPQNSYSERVTIAERQGASENRNCEDKSTQIKTNFRITMCIKSKPLSLGRILLHTCSQR